jgi:hypothetical protein
MMRWDEFFGDGMDDAPEQTATKSSGATNPPTMLAMLIPWVAFWTAMSISAVAGPAVVIGVCAIAALAFCRHERTVYDTLSLAAVLALVAASLAGAPLTLLLPASFLAFGLMWLVSALWLTPLSAYYVKGSYGGDKALRNVIYIQTNRIICLVWGVTYLVAAAAALAAPGATPLISELLPLPAAIFTVVFQRWYPAHVARG